MAAPISKRTRNDKQCSDAEFDQVYAQTWRRASPRYWTPVEVAAVASEWLTQGGAKSVLDVGSGVGKFCIVGASRTRARFIGVEHRFSLVLAARAAAQCSGVDDRTLFIHAEASIPLMRGYAAIYLFNPFGENLYHSAERLDGRVELGDRRYRRDVWLVEEVLRLMPIGGRLATYHGFGGCYPGGMALEREVSIGTDVLRLWVKKSNDAPGHFVETESGVVHVSEEGRPILPPTNL